MERLSAFTGSRLIEESLCLARITDIKSRKENYLICIYIYIKRVCEFSIVLNKAQQKEIRPNCVQRKN